MKYTARHCHDLNHAATLDTDTAAFIGEGSRLEEVTLKLAEKLIEGESDTRNAAIQSLVQQELDILGTIWDGRCETLADTVGST